MARFSPGRGRADNARGVSGEPSLYVIQAEYQAEEAPQRTVFAGAPQGSAQPPISSLRSLFFRNVFLGGGRRILLHLPVASNSMGVFSANKLRGVSRVSHPGYR